MICFSIVLEGEEYDVHTEEVCKKSEMKYIGRKTELTEARLEEGGHR